MPVLADTHPRNKKGGCHKPPAQYFDPLEFHTSEGFPCPG